MDPELSFKPTTPRKLSIGIKRFLYTIGLNGRPKFLRFSYISGKYLPQHCLSNCEQENINNGSEVVYGWTVWEDHNKHFIEAEFHAVIKKDGELIDITPRRDGEEKIMFVVDKTRKATRIDERTWRTWTNFKSFHGHVFQLSTIADFVDIDHFEKQINT